MPSYELHITMPYEEGRHLERRAPDNFSRQTSFRMDALVLSGTPRMRAQASMATEGWSWLPGWATHLHRGESRRREELAGRSNGERESENRSESVITL